MSRFAIDQGEYWRLVTSGFLHTGLFHLLFNMFALYILGGMLEPAIGRLRFGVIYFVSLLAGSFGALLLTPDGATVGRLGRDLRPDGRGGDRDARPRHQPDGERHRAAGSA